MPWHVLFGMLSWHAGFVGFFCLHKGMATCMCSLCLLQHVGHKTMHGGQPHPLACDGLSCTGIGRLFCPIAPKKPKQVLPFEVAIMF